MGKEAGIPCSRSVPAPKKSSVGQPPQPAHVTPTYAFHARGGAAGGRPQRGVGDLMANPPHTQRERPGSLPITSPTAAPPRRGVDPAALPPEAKLRPRDRRRYRLCNPPSARYPDGADVVNKRLVLASWLVSVPADARCELPPSPRRAVYGAAASGWARAQLRASRRRGGKRPGWSTERNLRKVARGERPLMVDLWERVHAWLSPPPPTRPLVPLRVSLFEGRPAIVRGQCGPRRPSTATPSSPHHLGPCQGQGYCRQ